LLFFIICYTATTRCFISYKNSKIYLIWIILYYYKIKSKFESYENTSVLFISRSSMHTFLHVAIFVFTIQFNLKNTLIDKIPWELFLTYTRLILVCIEFFTYLPNITSYFARKYFQFHVFELKICCFPYLKFSPRHYILLACKRPPTRHGVV